MFFRLGKVIVVVFVMCSNAVAVAASVQKSPVYSLRRALAERIKPPCEQKSMWIALETIRNALTLALIRGEC